MIDKNSVKAVIFDFDGTLYDFKRLPVRLIMARPFDVRKIAAERTVRRSLKGYDAGCADAFYVKFFSRLTSECFKSVDAARTWYFDVYLPHMVSVLSKRYTVRTDVAEVFSVLHRYGIQTAVFSDYGMTAERMSAVGLSADVCDVCYGAEDFGALKPATRPFLAIAHSFGVAPEHVLVVGDRSDTDGDGAATAGMQFIKIRTHKSMNDDTAVAWESFASMILSMYQS